MSQGSALVFIAAAGGDGAPVCLAYSVVAAAAAGVLCMSRVLVSQHTLYICIYMLSYPPPQCNALGSI